MIPPPPRRIRRLVGYLLGFGVSVGVGLSPYLGESKVPGFTPLLTLIPPTIRDTAIPLSAALMGIVAVVIQWHAADQVTRAWLHETFKRALLLVLASFLVLTIVHILVVVRIDDPAGGPPDTFVIGFLKPNEDCCPPKTSDIDCVYKATLDQAKVESCWGPKNVRVAKLALILSYLLFMSSFGLIVGLLLIKDETQLRRET